MGELRKFRCDPSENSLRVCLNLFTSEPCWFLFFFRFLLVTIDWCLRLKSKTFRPWGSKRLSCLIKRSVRFILIGENRHAKPFYGREWKYNCYRKWKGLRSRFSKTFSKALFILLLLKQKCSDCKTCFQRSHARPRFPFVTNFSMLCGNSEILWRLQFDRLLNN